MALAKPDETENPAKSRVLSILGPGLITGASDDDPSGIATYSQVGAQFGFSISWTMLFSYPLMAAIQEISGRIGATTGRGVAGIIRRPPLIPTLPATTTFWTSVVAILGTTISPYLFFWQASQEVEDVEASPKRDPLKYAPRQAKNALERIRLDTYIGMAFSNRCDCHHRYHRRHFACPWNHQHSNLKSGSRSASPRCWTICL